MVNDNANSQGGHAGGSGRKQEVDVIDVLRKLWCGRLFLIRWGVVGIVVGLVIAFSIPKEYTTVVKLAPELNNGQSALRGLSAMASMAGVELGDGASADAVSPELYPEIVQSVPFMTELFDVVVTDCSGNTVLSVADYVEDALREPWWSWLMKWPKQAVGWCVGLFAKEQAARECTDGTKVDPFFLTDTQNRVVQQLQDRVRVSVDTKTQVVSLSVTMQDPLVSATLTDTVVRNLQDYVTQYRTNKARHDLEFTQQLYDEARQSYYASQQRYARYMDRNQGVVRRTSRTEQERLSNEAALAFELYNQMAQQLQLARAKVQEMTPVYVVLQPATVPLRASKPSKILILIGCVMLAGVSASAWLCFGAEGWREIRRSPGDPSCKVRPNDDATA